jgi:hypothetical protein
MSCTIFFKKLILRKSVQIDLSFTYNGDYTGLIRTKIKSTRQILMQIRILNIVEIR